ncbi:prepilin-type N-terminal cleavage/methylation domain-containing protein [bacterium]|nr:prepilin-type N-terminal cleavage/methylation domain-containing protein [bacterium]
MKRAKTGFSLLEALLSLSLMSVLLGVVASLMHDTSALLRQAGKGDMLPLQTALELMSTDLRAAYKINRVDASGLELLKIDSADTSRLPNPIPVPPPASFSLHAAASSRKIRYYQLNGVLHSELTYPNGDTEDYEAVGGIDGLDASLLERGLVEISVSHQDNNSNPVKVISLTTRVVLHLPAQVVP